MATDPRSDKGGRSVSLTRALVGAGIFGLIMIGAGIGVGALVWSRGSRLTTVQPVNEASQSASPAVTLPMGQAPVGGTERKRTGFTNPDPNKLVFAKIDCPSGDYIEAGPDGRGTVFSSLRLDTFDTPSSVLVLESPDKAVEWGHAFSRLVTAVRVDVENKAGHDRSEPYTFAVYCTPDKDAAWVIAALTP